MRNKKGSMELSINAIVVLVLAICLLGLGLAFTKGMFENLKSRLIVPEPDVVPTVDDPIALPSETVSFKSARGAELTITFYNDYETGDITPSIECDSGTVIGKPQSVESGGTAKFKFIINKGDIPVGKQICTATFLLNDLSPVTKQIIFDVS